VRRLKAAFPRSKVRITSNFSIATDGIIDEILASGLDSVHISLNAATPESYEKIMGLKYEKTVRNVQSLIDKRHALKSPLFILLSMVLCPDNAGQEAMLNAMWRNKVDSIRFQRATDWMGEVQVSSPYEGVGRLYPCNDLFERIVIRSNGEIALCCQDNRGIVRLNVSERPILETFHSEVFRRAREKHLDGQVESMKMCRNCFAVRSNGANWLFRKYQ